jgi:hypothetical protein
MRHRTYLALDDAPAVQGDREFVGVDMKAEPDKLAPGYLSLAINKSLRTRSAATRGGIITPLFHNPARQPGASAAPILGAGLYSDDAGREYLLLARAGEVWVCREGMAPSTLTLPEPLAGPCELVQFLNRVRLLRGEGRVPWVWDGTGAGFVPADQSPTLDGSVPVPGTVSGEVVGDRMAHIVGRDEVIFTDLLDDNHYDSVLASVRVNAGSRETLVRIFPFFGTNVLALAQQGIFVIENVTGLLDNLRVLEVNRELGCVAARAVSAVGADVFFLSGTGVFRLSQIVENRIATAPVPVSDPLEPFFRSRVNWRAASGACSAVAAEYYHLAVPIDDSTGNNALVRYNTVTSAWEGWWTFPPGVELSDLRVTDWQGRKRLWAIDRPAGRTYLLDEGMVDRVMDEAFEIEDQAITRGYSQPPGHVRSPRGEVYLETWRPRFSLTVHSDGVNESIPLVRDRTKDRTRSTRWGRAAYDTSNGNDDHGAPYREDYSVVAGTAFQLQSGIVFDRRQAFGEPFTVRARGRYFTLDVTNTQGRCDLAGVALETVTTERHERTKT